MKQQQRILLETIQQNYNNEEFLSVPSPNGLFVSQTNTLQQSFLEKLIDIYVLRKKEYNKIDQARIETLVKTQKGGFVDLLLKLRFMAFCMEQKIEVVYEQFGMLKLLTNWMDILERIKAENKVSLCNSVFTPIHPQNHAISTVEQLIVYINYIAVDLQSVLQRQIPIPNLPGNQSATQISSKPKFQLSSDHLQVDDVMLFLNYLLPKTLFNIVIPQYLITGRPMTTTNPLEQRQRDFLYSIKNIEYFAKEKSHYQHLLKLLIATLLKFDLSQSQQKQLMLIAFKYFLLLNKFKSAEPFSILAKIYEKLTDPVRFALSDEFILFFKIIKKMGHTKFIKFLRQKYEWVQDLLKKIDPTAIVGYPKDSLNAFHSLNLMEHFFVSPGTTTQRYIEIYEPYSLLYFYIGIKALDINIRFYYMGQFTAQVEKKQLLLEKDKCQIQFKGNIIAIEKGIYMFEFDNSYSWMKGKNILYDTVVLTPLEITKQGIQKEKFLPVLYNKFDMNECDQSYFFDLANLSMQMEKPLELKRQEQVHIHSDMKKFNVSIQFDADNKVYNLKSTSNGRVYEYQTQNQLLFMKKANEILQNLKQLQYECLIEGTHKLLNIDMLERWIINPVDFDFTPYEQKTQDKKQQVLQAPQMKQVISSQITQIVEKKIQKIAQDPSNKSKQQQNQSYPTLTQQTLQFSLEPAKKQGQVLEQIQIESQNAKDQNDHQSQNKVEKQGLKELEKEEKKDTIQTQ